MLNENEKILSRRKSALKYYHKNKETIKYKKNKLKYVEQRKVVSLNYYYRNKQKCIENSNRWHKANPVKSAQIKQKYYYKRKYNIEIFFIKESSIIKT